VVRNIPRPTIATFWFAMMGGTPCLWRGDVSQGWCLLLLTGAYSSGHILCCTYAIDSCYWSVGKTYNVLYIKQLQKERERLVPGRGGWWGFYPFLVLMLIFHNSSLFRGHVFCLCGQVICAALLLSCSQLTPALISALTCALLLVLFATHL
jgi:hypothetical protein